MQVVTEDGRTQTLSVNMLKSSCPLLVSTLRETLRVSAHIPSTRYVLEDTWIAGKYLLKKGSEVQIANGVLHSDKTIWGDDTDIFNPARFVDTSANAPNERVGQTPKGNKSDSGTE